MKAHIYISFIKTVGNAWHTAYSERRSTTRPTKKKIYMHIYFCNLYADKLLYQLYQVAIKIDHLHFFFYDDEF